MLEIRLISPSDREDYLNMARAFYSTDAVLFRVDDSHLRDGFNELIRSQDYMLCHILVFDGKTAGYALISKAYSQEAGGMVYWIEELYIMPEYRSRGIGTKYLRWLFDRRPPEVKRFRLEVERENAGTVALYRRMGFDFLEYEQMFWEP